MRTDKAPAVRLTQCPQEVITKNIFGSDGRSNTKCGIERSCEGIYPEFPGAEKREKGLRKSRGHLM